MMKISPMGILVIGMLYKSEQQKILATIKRAGGGKKCTIVTPDDDVDEFTGVGGPPSELSLYFMQSTHNNDEIQVNPGLVEAMKIIVCPLDDNGCTDPTFIDKCKHKGSKVLLPSGEELSIKFARITSPDNVTPIVARLSLGG